MLVVASGQLAVGEEFDNNYYYIITTRKIIFPEARFRLIVVSPTTIFAQVWLNENQ